MQPILDEAAFVGRLANLASKPHLKRGQGTDHADPGLRDDNADGGQVYPSEPDVSYPGPAEMAAADVSRSPPTTKATNSTCAINTASARC